MRHFLIPPGELSCPGMHRHDGVGIGIVTGPAFALIVGIGIAGREYHKIVSGIDGRRVPHRSAAEFPRIRLPGVAARLARRRGSPKFPALASRLGIIRLDHSPGFIFGAGGTDEHHAVMDLRRLRIGIILLGLRVRDGRIGLPDQFSSSRVQRHQMAVKQRSIDLAIGHRDTPGLRSATRLGIVKLVWLPRPYLPTGLGIPCLDVIGRGNEVKHAVYHQWLRLEAVVDACMQPANQLEPCDIVPVDVGERRISLIVIRPAMQAPIVDIRVGIAQKPVLRRTLRR